MSWSKNIGIAIFVLGMIIWGTFHFFGDFVFERYSYFNLSKDDKKVYNEWLATPTGLDVADLNVTPVSARYIKAQDDFIKFYMSKMYLQNSNINFVPNATPEMIEFDSIAIEFASSENFEDKVTVDQIYFPKVIDEFELLVRDPEYSLVAYNGCSSLMTYNQCWSAITHARKLILMRILHNAQNNRTNEVMGDFHLLAKAFRSEEHMNLYNVISPHAMQNDLCNMIDYFMIHHPEIIEEYRLEIIKILESFQVDLEKDKYEYPTRFVIGMLREKMTAGYIQQPLPSNIESYSYPRLELLALYHADQEVPYKLYPFLFIQSGFNTDLKTYFENESEIQERIKTLIEELEK